MEVASISTRFRGPQRDQFDPVESFQSLNQWLRRRVTAADERSVAESGISMTDLRFRLRRFSFRKDEAPPAHGMRGSVFRACGASVR
jgi:hypothetical protein